jgi:hypothetical protein
MGKGEGILIPSASAAGAQKSKKLKIVDSDDDSSEVKPRFLHVQAMADLLYSHDANECNEVCRTCGMAT